MCWSHPFHSQWSFSALEARQAAMQHLDDLLPAVLHVYLCLCKRELEAVFKCCISHLGWHFTSFDKCKSYWHKTSWTLGKGPCDFEHGRPNSDFWFPQCKSSITPLLLAGLDQIYAAVIQREVWPIELRKGFSFYLSLVSPWEGSISCHCPLYPTGFLLKSVLAGRQPTGSSKVKALWMETSVLPNSFFFGGRFCRQEVCRLCTKICSFRKGQGFFGT